MRKGFNPHKIFSVTNVATVSLLCTRIGSFSTMTATSTRAAKKQKVLWSKQQLLTCSFLFLYISLPSLHDCDLKLPQATFYGGHKHKPTNFSFSLNLVAVPKKSIPGKFTNIWDFTPIRIIATKFEKQRIFFNSDVFDAVVMWKRSLYIQVKEVTNLVQRISIHRSFESQILPQLTDTAHALPFLFLIRRQK